MKFFRSEWMNEWISEKFVMKKKKTERKRRKKWTTKYTPFSTSSFLYMRLKTAKCQTRWIASPCQLSYFLFRPLSFFNSSFTPLPSKYFSQFNVLSCKLILFFLWRFILVLVCKGRFCFWEIKNSYVVYYKIKPR